MGAGQDGRADVYGFAKTLDFGRIQRATRGPGTATITAVRIRSPARIDVIALLLALTAALIARALVQVRLREAGLAEPVASDLAYLVVPLILAILSLPVLSKHRHFIAALFSTRPLTLRVVVAAIVVGLLFRVATGSLLVARIAFGWQVNDDPAAIEGPLLHIQCPPVASMLLGLAVSSILIPLIEELVHRGFVQTFLHRHGAFISVGASAMLFAVFHPASGLLFAFAGGVLLGAMYRLSGCLWPPIIAHAVINLAPQFTWRCMSLQWNPQADSLPLWVPGLVASCLFALALCSGLWLLLAIIRCRTP